MLARMRPSVRFGAVVTFALQACRVAAEGVAADGAARRTPAAATKVMQMGHAREALR